MILLDDFYTVSSQEAIPGSIKASIAINGRHKIFEGHFPGLPIVPGVCMMQIIRELMETATGQSLRLTDADTMKFLSIINPDNHPGVDVLIHYTGDNGVFAVQATLFSDSVTFFKLKATMKTAEWNP